jgi:BirA family biotin operon repressor/biotin-[acetyl-CoA-carboxylase] ligase
MGRQWVSEPGNLFLSVILRPNTHRYWTWIPLLGAVCVLDLVSRDEAYRRQSGSHVRRFSIKWPNDLWIDGAKWGGILCEAVHAQSASPFIVLGLGLNAGLAPKGLDQETASIDDPEFSDRLRQPLVAAIAEGVSRLDREGPGWVRAAYESWAEFRRGDLVQWKSEGKVLEAKVAELGEMGELRVEFQDGSLRSLYAEEVSAVRARA